MGGPETERGDVHAVPAGGRDARAVDGALCDRDRRVVVLHVRRLQVQLQPRGAVFGEGAGVGAGEGAGGVRARADEDAGGVRGAG